MAEEIVFFLGSSQALKTCLCPHGQRPARPLFSIEQANWPALGLLGIFGALASIMTGSPRLSVHRIAGIERMVCAVEHIEKILFSRHNKLPSFLGCIAGPAHK